jgi:hypothetical protein
MSMRVLYLHMYVQCGLSRVCGNRDD